MLSAFSAMEGDAQASVRAGARSPTRSPSNRPQRGDRGHAGGGSAPPLACAPCRMPCSGRCAAIGALLPDGWGGLARQLAIFIPFDIAYELSRAFATGGEQTALQHARDVVHAEKVLGIYHEHAVQDWALDAPDFVMEVAKFTYFQCQFTITFGFVIWVYIWRNEAYMMLRNVPLRDVHAGRARLHPLPDGAAAAAAWREHFIDPLADRGAQPAGHAREALRQSLRGDAEPAHGHGDPRRRDRRAGHAPSAGPRDLGRSIPPSSSSRSWRRPITSSSTPSPASGC